MQAVVFGNATLDVLCFPVEDVPRRESIAFERGVVSPGGCGSNVAVGLSALGIDTALVARVGMDEAADLIELTWKKVGVDRRFVKRDLQSTTAISIGLIDHSMQPRFIHMPGANAKLNVNDVDISLIANEGARSFHIGGYFVLPGIINHGLEKLLASAQHRGILTSLDVVQSPRMDHPEHLWPCLPHLDIFLCNADEAMRITGFKDPRLAARSLLDKGTKSVVVKLGSNGCWVENNRISVNIPAAKTQIVDTTGAGDAFASGLIAGLLKGSDLVNACRMANESGARIAGAFGTITAWLEEYS
jgi:sugar/nucleoside kinase (ribokinase family)